MDIKVLRKRIDSIYREHLNRLDVGIENQNTSLIASASWRLMFLIEIMENCMIYPHSHCIYLRADIGERIERGRKNEC